MDKDSVVAQKNNLDENMIGELIPVSHYYWIPNDDFIGLTPHALHENVSINFTGSITIGATLRIKDIYEDKYVVMVLWDETPSGLSAPQGTIFLISPEELNLHIEQMKVVKAKQAKRIILQKLFCN